MQPAKTVSKPRIILKWVMMVGAITLVSFLCFFWSFNFTAPTAESQEGMANPVVHAVFFFVLGMLFLGAGVAGYFLVIMTCCFTFDYTRPVWNSIKAKAFLCNILVIMLLGLGVGMLASAFLSPVLQGFGLHGTQADLMPVLAALVGIQLIQLWVLVWAPVEKRLIHKRLATMGITPDHLKGAVLAGISNPASKLSKQFGAIEEDMGALWVTPDRLAWRGDVEQFDLTREQVVEIERKAYARSNTSLAGIEHPILHVQLPDGSIRQMRLHVEGLWTLGQKRQTIDALNEAINGWYAAGAASGAQASTVQS